MASSAMIARMASCALWVLVGCVFGVAGVQKIIDPAAFANSVASYRMLPYPLAAAVAVYLPWCEILASLLLLTTSYRGGAIALLAILSLVFVAANAIALLRGLDVDCGCFGREADLGIEWSLVRAILLAIVSNALLASFIRKNSVRSNPVAPRARSCD